MLELLILAGVVAGGVWFYRSRQQAKQLAQGDEPQRPALGEGDEPDLLRAGPGAVLSLHGIGPELLDFDAKVLSRHIYVAGGFEWFELEADKGDSKVWIEVVDDDEMEVSVTLHSLRFKDLGLSKKDLRVMRDDEEGELSYQGVEYSLENSGGATFHKDGNRESVEDFDFWDFESDDGATLSIAAWDDGSWDANLSVDVRPSQVTLYSLD